MKNIIITVAFIICGFSALFAQQETSSFDVNGVKVIFKPTLKTMVSVRVYFRGGVANYTAQQSGIERFALAAAIKCGTKQYTANQFRDTSDRYGISFANSAEFDYSGIEMHCILKYFDKGWDLFADAVKNPVFDETEVELLKNKIISNISVSTSQPKSYADMMAVKNAFEGTLYATDPGGSEQNIAAFTANDLKKHYESMLNKNRMFIVIAGKLTQQQITDKLASLAASLPAAPYQPVALTAPVWNDNKNVFEQRAMATNYIEGVVNAPVMSSPDYLPFDMGLMVLGGALFSELRTSRNLSYSQGAHLSTQLMPYTLVYVSTTNPKEAVEVMVNLLSRIKGFNLSDRSLNRLKSNYISSNYEKLQSASAITSNLGLAEIMGGWSIFENVPAMLEQVTSEQIASAFQKYFKGVRWAYLGDVNLAHQADDAFKLHIK